MLKSLSACKAAGIPVYAFGSPELDAVHASSLGPAVAVATRGEGWYFSGLGWYPRRTYVVHRREYAQHADGRQYVVDHGGFFTLNTLHAGQVCPEMRDIAAH